MNCSRSSPLLVISIVLLGLAELAIPRCCTGQDIGSAGNDSLQLLRRMDLGPDQLAAFADGQPLSSDEQRQAARILYRLGQLSPVQIALWSHAPAQYQPLLERPREHSARFWRLSGRVTRVERVELAESMSRLVGFPGYYAVTMQLEEKKTNATILTRAIPLVWPTGQELDQASSVDGYLLKRGGSADGVHELVVAAQRVAWHPDQVQPDYGITPAHVLLASHGMDIGLLDEARRNDKAALDNNDQQCFYQMLSATAEIATRRAHNLVEPLELTPLFAQPTTPEEHARSLQGLINPGAQHGRLVSTTATARRILKVRVEDPDMRRRFGFDHYFQIDAFMPLRGEAVSLRQYPGDDHSPVFRNSFPITICVLRLPDWLSEQEKLAEQIEIRGFYYRLWAHRSDYVSSFGADRQQISPLLIALPPERAAAATPATGRSGLLIGLAAVLGLGLLWIVLWRVHRRDESFRRVLLSRFHRKR